MYIKPLLLSYLLLKNFKCLWLSNENRIGVMIFNLKRINFLGRECVIICQNENGPCPLLAISNALILQRKISLNPDIPTITLNNLVQIVANLVLERCETMANVEHMTLFESVLNILPKLANGLDLNVHFNSVSKFEFTEEISVFDSLSIPLLHGWIVDRKENAVVNAVKLLSYNQLIVKVVEYGSLNERINNFAFAGQSYVLNEDEKELLKEGPIIDSFLKRTSSQLTYQGVLDLYSFMNDRQIAVFFRNNHFSTIFCYNGQLFVLVTDQGYLHEPMVIWELLDTKAVEGNSEYYNENFYPLSSILQDQEEQQRLILMQQQLSNSDNTTTTTNNNNLTYQGTVASPINGNINSINSNSINNNNTPVNLNDSENPLLLYSSNNNSNMNTNNNSIKPVVTPITVTAPIIPTTSAADVRKSEPLDLLNDENVNSSTAVPSNANNSSVGASVTADLISFDDDTSTVADSNNHISNNTNEPSRQNDSNANNEEGKLVVYAISNNTDQELLARLSDSMNSSHNSNGQQIINTPITSTIPLAPQPQQQNIHLYHDNNSSISMPPPRLPRPVSQSQPQPLQQQPQQQYQQPNYQQPQHNQQVQVPIVDAYGNINLSQEELDRQTAMMIQLEEEQEYRRQQQLQNNNNKGTRGNNSGNSSSNGNKGNNNNNCISS